MFEIIIKNLKLFGFHGVNPEEKEKGQDFIFNLRIMLKKSTFKTGGSYTDNISGTVNYSEIIALTKEVNNSCSYDLLETLCEELAGKIAAYSPLISAVKVKVEKPSPPIKEDIGSVGVSFKTASKNSPGYMGSYLNKNYKSGEVFYISIGTNMGNRKNNLKIAVENLLQNNFISIEKISSIYKTEPMYVKEQASFYNIAIKGKIIDAIPGKVYGPFELLGFLKSIEYKMGRGKSSLRYGPRIIDLDLLYFNGLQINSEILALPHPKMAERKFVLIPLREIEPDFILENKSIDNIISGSKFNKEVIMLGPWE